MRVCRPFGEVSFPVYHDTTASFHPISTPHPLIRASNQTPPSSRASISPRSPDRSLELCHISLFLLAALRAEKLPPSGFLSGPRSSRRRAAGERRKRSRKSRSLNLDSHVNPDIVHRVSRIRDGESIIPYRRGCTLIPDAPQETHSFRVTRRSLRVHTGRWYVHNAEPLDHA